MQLHFSLRGGNKFDIFSTNRGENKVVIRLLLDEVRILDEGTAGVSTCISNSCRD